MLPSSGSPIAAHHRDVEDRLAVVRGDRQPADARDHLMVVGGERLVLRELVAEGSEAEEHATLGKVAHPLQPIREDRHERVEPGRPLLRPAVVAGHHLDQRVAFLGAADEEAPLHLGKADLDPGLAEAPRLVGRVVHVADRPRQRALGLELPPEQQAGVADADVGVVDLADLLLALVVLAVSGDVDQETEAEPERRDRPVVLVPLDQPSTRLGVVVVAGVLGGVDRRRLLFVRRRRLLLIARRGLSSLGSCAREAWGTTASKRNMHGRQSCHTESSFPAAAARRYVASFVAIGRPQSAAHESGTRRTLGAPAAVLESLRPASSG